MRKRRQLLSIIHREDNMLADQIGFKYHDPLSKLGLETDYWPHVPLTVNYAIRGNCKWNH